MKSENFQSAISRPFITTESGTRAKKAVFADLDSEVLAAVRGGETEAFGKLVSLYEDFVYTLVYGIVRSEEAAKDIAQETFLRAYKGIRRFELKSSFKTWLYRIAHNTAISYVNRQKNERLVDMDQIDQKATDRMNSHSLKLTLEKLIGKLNPTYRAVVIFHYYDDLKYEEIAEILDCPLGTVKIRLLRAKKELKRLWNEYAK